MAAEFDGWAIARQRIAKEARERTGKLDLAGLGPVQFAKVCRRLSRRPSAARYSGQPGQGQGEQRTHETRHECFPVTAASETGAENGRPKPAPMAVAQIL